MTKGSNGARLHMKGAEVSTMKHQQRVHDSSSNWRGVALALACAGTAAACSGNYAIGSLPAEGELADDQSWGGQRVVANSSVPALLNPPDVTFTLPDSAIEGAVGVGDLDGDGFDDSLVQGGKSGAYGRVREDPP